MPYVVLALGVVLSICGALSIYFGYGIIEIERGWTGVIAGATALTGGIVVIALGLVIKGLGDLRAALVTSAGHDAPAKVGLATAPEPERFEDGGSRPGKQASPSATTEPRGREPEGQDDLQTQEPQSQEADVLAVIIASEADLDVAESPSTPRETVDLVEPRRAWTHESAVRPVAPEPIVAQDVVEIPAPKPRQKVTLKPQVAAPRKDEPAPAPIAEPETPSMDDWLDRAFSALDNEVASTPLRDPGASERTWPMATAKHETTGFAPESPASESVAPHSPAPESLVQELPATEPPFSEPATPDQPAPAPVAREPEDAPAPVAPEPTEIGRYEADGTSYIMYTDGSIDAQSEAGVFRFNSMAELRAYIEGTA